MLSGKPGVTQLLAELSRGNRDAMAELVPLVYHELHKLARHHLAAERPDHTLQPTALVHEAYVRLVGQDRIHWKGRVQFYGVASQVMRRILVDYARSRGVVSDEQAAGLVALDAALAALAVEDAQQSRIVELRYFGGLTIEQTAEVLGISPATVKRDWNVAKAWLHRELENTRP